MDEVKARQADATPVVLMSHDRSWAMHAAAEGRRIVAALAPAILRVEHIGSTAIPGISAKPTIDLMPLVRCEHELDACRAPMEALGYLWRGEYGIKGRRYSVMELDGRRLFHVHIFAEANENVARHLAFRDYLRASREEAMAYEAAKRAAAAAHPGDSMAYSQHKSGWISACLERAVAWAQAQ